jgi:glycosyltransferase involved in cell wall biosynthesis
MTRVVHIGAVDPERGHGGVEQFARDLQDARSDETVFLSYHNPDTPPWVVAERSNKLNLESGVIQSDDIVVADGYYGLGLAGKVARLIIVCHGSYGAMLREYNINPPEKIGGMMSWMRSAAEQQERAYREGEVVAVSDASAYDLYDIYGVQAHVIRNGIDLRKYRTTEAENGWVEVAGKDLRKGSDTVEWLREDGRDISRLGFKGEKEDRWLKFRYAILPSRYEGGQYAALEAMACNLTIVAYNSGFFDLDVGREYYYGTYDYFPRAFGYMMDDAERKPPLNPREWVYHNATIQQFKAEWRTFLDEDKTDGGEDSS